MHTAVSPVPHFVKIVLELVQLVGELKNVYVVSLRTQIRYPFLQNRMYYASFEITSKQSNERSSLLHEPLTIYVWTFALST